MNGDSVAAGGPSVNTGSTVSGPQELSILEGLRDQRNCGFTDSALRFRAFGIRGSGFGMLVGSGFRVLGSRISEDLVSTMLIVVGLGIKAAVSVSRVLLPRDFRYTQLRWVSTTLLEQRGCYPVPPPGKHSTQDVLTEPWIVML